MELLPLLDSTWVGNGDEEHSLLTNAGTALVETFGMQPWIQYSGWTETFPIPGKMADARNVRACGWQARPPLPIDKGQHVGGS
jgi:hypothetical protein